MILIDTNVLSQPMRANGSAKVNQWLDAHFDRVGIPVLAVAEIVFGIELIDDWERKIQLTNALATMRIRYEDRFVPFDMAAGSVEASTAKPWFMLVISTTPSSARCTGWFAPRWP